MLRGKSCMTRKAGYYSDWRAAHLEYRERQRVLRKIRRRLYGRGDRSDEYAKACVKRAKQVKTPYEPLPLLMPHLQRGVHISFWEDELRLDLAQERALAELEGRDPEQAAAAYHARESNWYERAAYQLLPSLCTGPIVDDELTLSRPRPQGSNVNPLEVASREQ